MQITHRISLSIKCCKCGERLSAVEGLTYREFDHVLEIEPHICKPPASADDELRVLRSISQGDDFAKLFFTASDDAKIIETQLRTQNLRIERATSILRIFDTGPAKYARDVLLGLNEFHKLNGNF